MAARPLTLALLVVAIAMPARAERPSADNADLDALLAAAAARDSARLDRLAASARPPVAALAAVALIDALDDEAARRRAAVKAGFVVRWSLLGPLPGGAWTLDRIDGPLAQWASGEIGSGPWPGLRQPVAWRSTGPSARFGRLDISATGDAHPGGIYLARTGLRVADGGDVIVHVYSANAWRLWLDGRLVGSGVGDASLRTSEPVEVTLGAGLHRVLLATHADRPAAIATRLSLRDGRPSSFDPAPGPAGPHPMSLAGLPGQPSPIADPLGGLEPDEIPPAFAPPGPVMPHDELDADALDAALEVAPFELALWRARAVASDDDLARRAWGRVAELDPLDLNARRHVDRTAWPAPSRDPGRARTRPPADAGPVWFPFAEHEVEVHPDGALIVEHRLAIRVNDPAAFDPSSLPSGGHGAFTLLRAGHVMPLAQPIDGAPFRADDVLIIIRRQRARPGALRIQRPNGPVGRFMVRVRAIDGAPISVTGPDGADIQRVEADRIWRWSLSGRVDGSISISTVRDDRHLAAVLGRRLAPAHPVRLPSEPLDAVVGAALEQSAGQPPWSAAETLMAGLAEGGYRSAPLFARLDDGPDLDPDGWRPLIAVGDLIVDPTHRDGARPAALQGTDALRAGPIVERMTLPIDPPDRHRLTAKGTVRFSKEGGVLFAAELATTGRSRLPDRSALGALAPDGEILEYTPERVAVQWSVSGGLSLPLPIGDPTGHGPHAIDTTIDVSGPAGRSLALPADVVLESPAGRYARTTRRIADGWRITRRLSWTGTATDAAFVAALIEAEAARLGVEGDR